MADTKKRATGDFFMDRIDIMSERVFPQNLQGYERINSAYRSLLKMHDVGADFEKDKRAAALADDLNRKILDIISSNPNKIISEEITGKQLSNLMHSHVRQVEDKQYGDRVAAEFFFGSVLPDQNVRNYLTLHNISKEDYPDNFSQATLSKQTPTMRSYLLKLMPGTPWVQLDITDKDAWYVRGGIDTLLTMINDDCPLCENLYVIENPFLTRFLKHEKRSDFQAVEINVQQARQKYSISDKRIEIVPYSMLEKACREYRSCQ